MKRFVEKFLKVGRNRRAQSQGAKLQPHHESKGSDSSNIKFRKGVDRSIRSKSESELRDLRMEAVNEGIKEHIKEKVRETEKIKDKLKALTEHEDTVLLQAKTFFPFDFFPDTLVIDTNKVAITKKRFFATQHLNVINYKDISDVELETSLFLANLSIEYYPKIEGMMAPEQRRIKIRLLKKSEAIKAQHIIKGILLARREEIDVTRLTPDEFTEVITQLGESNVDI